MQEGYVVRPYSLFVIAILASACGEESARQQAITIDFAAMVGDTGLACGTEYADLGLSTGIFALKDFRYFVHDIQLFGTDGTPVPLRLENTDWQESGVVLLDFEDGSGKCSNGNDARNTQITGQVPEGDYRGIVFSIGVPSDLNHADPTMASGPLTFTSMHWGWQGGYKFLRFDGSVDDTSFKFHLGSTECRGTIGDISDCAHANRPTITLPNFSLDAPTVTLHIDRLLENADPSQNTEDTAVGCMSGINDPECAPLFANLGLNTDGSSRDDQSTFTTP